jgi:glycosyltransferase involved in cell wall biosynthesis
MKVLICAQVVDQHHPILGFFHGWLLEFANYFEEVHIICLQKGVYEFPSHVHVYSLGKEQGESNIKYLFRFYRYFGYVFFKVRVDYVFFHMGYIFNNLAAPFFVIRKLFQTKFYWWKTHGTLTCLGHSALIFSDAVYTAAAQSFPSQSPKKRVVGHAIEIVPAEDISLKKSEPPILLCVGRVTPVKQIELVIDAAKILQGRGVPCQVRIVGAFADSAYEKKLRAYVEASSIVASVTFVGPLHFSEVRREYSSARVLVHPSETGGIDKVVLEAMQYKLPPVAHERTYGSLLNPFALAVSSQDAGAYADVIEPILRNEYSRHDAEALRKIVVENHSLTTLMKRIFQYD